MNKAYRLAGFAACFIAVLAMSGGHWLILQSVAWARMIVQFSHHDSLSTALAKTFDGRHPCALCLRVRQGHQEDQRQGDRVPWLKPEKMPELFCDARCVPVPHAPAARAEAPAEALDFFYDFVESPPTPPPRAGVAAL